MDIINRLMRLIAERSETNTVHELEFETVLETEIQKIPFFSENPHFMGKYALEGDTLGRSVVWALSPKPSAETVILFGHHDTVDLQAYGDLESIATDPIALGKAFSADAQWLYGRGSCDMKAGLAIEIDLLERSTVSVDYPNVLFLSVPDEENLSSGMRNCIPLLKMLQAKHHLTYKLAVLTEPHERIDDKKVVVHTGSVGKMMPYIMVKGFATHSGMPFSGLTAVGVLMEIVKAIEANTEMADVVQKKMTPPPLFLGLKDLKTRYDVTTPEFAMGYFNWLYLKDNLKFKMEQLQQLCVWSVEDAINQYNYSYNEFLRKQNLPSYECCQEFKVDVLLYNDLRARYDTMDDFNMLKQNLIELEPHLNLQALTIELTKKMVERVFPETPVVVVGLMPPFYPAVDHFTFFDENLKTVLEERAAKLEIGIEVERYFMGISDMSYLSPMSEALNQTLEQMPLNGAPYTIDLYPESIPTMNIGPWGKGIHQKNECVYKDDVIRIIPSLIEAVIKKCL